MNRLASIALALAALALAGCGGDQQRLPAPAPKVVTIATPVVVPVSCVDKTFPRRVTFGDTAKALGVAPDAAARYDLLAAEWAPKQKRLDALESQVDACR